MSDGDIFRDIKAALEQDPKSLTIVMRDRLVLGGIIQLYDEIGEIKTRQGKTYTMYKVLIGLGSIVAVLMTGFLWGIFTGEISVLVK